MEEEQPRGADVEAGRGEGGGEGVEVEAEDVVPAAADGEVVGRAAGEDPRGGVERGRRRRGAGRRRGGEGRGGGPEAGGRAAGVRHEAAAVGEDGGRRRAAREEVVVRRGEPRCDGGGAEGADEDEAEGETARGWWGSHDGGDGEVGGGFGLRFVELWEGGERRNGVGGNWGTAWRSAGKAGVEESIFSASSWGRRLTRHRSGGVAGPTRRGRAGAVV